MSSSKSVHSDLCDNGNSRLSQEPNDKQVNERLLRQSLGVGYFIQCKHHHHQNSWSKMTENRVDM